MLRAITTLIQLLMMCVEATLDDAINRYKQEHHELEQMVGLLSLPSLQNTVG